MGSFYSNRKRSTGNIIKVRYLSVEIQNKAGTGNADYRSWGKGIAIFLKDSQKKSSEGRICLVLRKQTTEISGGIGFQVKNNKYKDPEVGAHPGC